MLGLGRFRRRARAARALGVRSAPSGVAVAVPPPPPPPPVPLGAKPSRVRLIMADGSERPLPDDPELAERADYLVNAILKPPPPG